ncbi:MAG: nucleotide sugar dehydrogenase [Bacilli bacterium]
MNKNIVVVGLGYVGLSLSVLLAQNNHVKCVDIAKERVNLVNSKKSPIVDQYITDYLANKKLDIHATVESTGLYGWADFILIATPTNYDPESNCFDTGSIESVLKDIKASGTDATIIIKSTIPIGYTKRTRELFALPNLLFSPEFLREGNALRDNLFPSRIIVGLTDDSTTLKEKAQSFGELLNEGAIEKTDIILMRSIESEAVKLFANSYLATRVAFFNELDTYAEMNNLDSKSIIHGMCKDPRIGDFYNNPSFGYGGYCLPKDTKQLAAEFVDIPNNLIDAIVASNVTRSKYVANRIVSLAKKKSKTPIVGVYRLIMKADSDNFRSSSIQTVISVLKENNIQMVLYEPSLQESSFNGIPLMNDFQEFANLSTIIICNRIDDKIEKIDMSKVYTRDIYRKN